MSAGVSAISGGYAFTESNPFSELPFNFWVIAVARPPFLAETESASITAQLLGIDALEAAGNIYQTASGAALPGQQINFQQSPTTVPEPTTLALLATGLFALRRTVKLWRMDVYRRMFSWDKSVPDDLPRTLRRTDIPIATAI